jgi:glycosyltransferase 2 family protein
MKLLCTGGAVKAARWTCTTTLGKFGPLPSGAVHREDIELNRLRPFMVVIKIGITVGVLLLLFDRVDGRAVIALWSRIDPYWATLALVFLAPNLYFQYRRWRVGLARVHPSVGWQDAFRPLLVGFAMGAVTPGRMGELGLVVLLPPGGRRRMLGVMAVMRAYGLVASLSLGLVMLALRPDLLGFSTQTGRIGAVSALGVVLALVVAAEYLFDTTDHPRLVRLVERVPGVPQIFIGVQALLPVDRARFTIWSLAMSLAYLSQLVWLMRAFGGEVTWPIGMAAGAITIGIVAVLPVSFGNIGIRESAAVVVWQHVGIAESVAFNAAFGLFLVNIVLPGLLGLVWNAVTSRSRKTASSELGAPT